MLIDWVVMRSHKHETATSMAAKIIPEVYANRLGSHEESQSQNCHFNALKKKKKKKQEARHGLSLCYALQLGLLKLAWCALILCPIKKK